MNNSSEKKISEKKSSPDRIDEYLRVSSPGVFVLIAALVLVMVAFIVWGISGKLPVTKTVKGFVWVMPEDDKASLSKEDSELYADELEKPMVIVLFDSSKYNYQQINQKPAVIKTADGYTCECSEMNMTEVPLSRAELDPVISDKSDWLIERVMEGDYNYLAVYSADKELEEHMYETVDVSVVVEEVHPISFLMR